MKKISLFLALALVCAALFCASAPGEAEELLPEAVAVEAAANDAEEQEMRINYKIDKTSANKGDVITATWDYENIAEPFSYVSACWLVEFDGAGSTKEVVRTGDKASKSLSLTVLEDYTMARLWVGVGGADDRSTFALSDPIPLNVTPASDPTPAATPEAGTTPAPTPTGGQHMHSFANGVCTICGYRCPHEKTWKASGETTTRNYVDTGSDAYHQEEIVVTPPIEICESCNQLVNFQPAVTTTNQMGHAYEQKDGKYVCQLCGHVDTCLHENLTIQSDDLVYEDYRDNKFHRQTLKKGSSVQEAWCEDCGVIFDLNELDYNFEKYELHNYKYDVNPNGICAVCGHVNTCQHNGMAMSYTGQRIYDIGDEMYHYLFVSFSKTEEEKVRYCPDCGREFVNDPERVNGYPIPHVFDDEGVCTVCGHKRLGPAIPNVYALDLSGVTKTNETGGTGVVKRTEGNQPATGLYARVTWVYTLSNEDTFAYCAMKDVIANGDEITFNMVSPKAPYGATLEAVQVALVKDEFADEKGTYEALASAKK